MNSFALQVLALLFCLVSSASAEEPLRVGVIASLSGFAAQYGQAVVDGATLATNRLHEKGVAIELIVEDDGSDMKQTVTAYHRLKSKGKIKAIIGGSWWLQAIVPLAEKDRVVLLSCETVYNDQTIDSRFSFLLQGYLSPWVLKFEPLLQKAKLRKGLMLRSTSGFGITLGNAFRQLFSKEGREYLGELVYTDLDIQDARALVLKIKQLQPDVVYIDGHPGSLATVLQRMRELRLNSLYLLSNAIAKQMKMQAIEDARDFPNLYFSDRTAASEVFTKEFIQAFHKPPRLNADLGALAVELLSRVANSQDIAHELSSQRFLFGDTEVAFDAKNVWRGPEIQINRLLDMKSPARAGDGVVQAGDN